jgi:hypothetical protein
MNAKEGRDRAVVSPSPPHLSTDDRAHLPLWSMANGDVRGPQELNKEEDDRCLCTKPRTNAEASGYRTAGSTTLSAIQQSLAQSSPHLERSFLNWLKSGA